MITLQNSKNTFQLYLGDCLDIIPNLPKVQAVITDIPFGTTACAWDTIIPLDKMWHSLSHVTENNTPIVLFSQEPFSSYLRISNIKKYKYDWHWQKERITNIMQVKKRAGKVVENISVFYDKQCCYNPQMVKHEGKLVTNKIKNGKLGKLTDNKGDKSPIQYNDNGYRYPHQIIKFKRDILTSNLHQTQKPVALMEYLIKTYSNEGDTILDFTFGSCSTGIACLNTNRNFIGIEKDESYFNIGSNRLSEALKCSV